MMLLFYRWTWPGVIAVSLLGCGKPAPPPPPQAAHSVAPRESLSHVVETYWQQSMALTPWFSWGGGEMRYAEAPVELLTPRALADSLAIEQRSLADERALPRDSLDADSTLTYDVFRRERELTIEAFTFPTELMPVNAYDALPERFASMASAAERYAMAGERDLEYWQTRASAYASWTTQAIANLREGLRRGYTLPRVAVEKTLPVLAALGEDAPDNVFFQSNTASGALKPALDASIRDKVLPAYRELHDFLQREYLPAARTTVGMSALPLGAAWYAHLIRRATDGTATPAELHTLGSSEVEKVRARMQPLLAETGFAGNAAGLVDSMRGDARFSYKNADELVRAYDSLESQLVAATAAAIPAPTPSAVDVPVEAADPASAPAMVVAPPAQPAPPPATPAGAATAFLPVAPRTRAQIRPLDRYREMTAPGLSYQRSLAYAKFPGELYVNVAGLTTLPSIGVAAQFLREGVPGHHYQISLLQERGDLPKFRRFGRGAPAFTAGWGLYAATLGDELGAYRDPQARFGSLLSQLQCAVGLVIDTGIHAQNWTRQRALDYVHAQVPLDDATNAAMVDRVIALPGEALSCSVGLLKIQALRAHAQQTLGARFDVLSFHTELLKNGGVPLDLLDGAMTRWAESSVAVAPKVE